MVAKKSDGGYTRGVRTALAGFYFRFVVEILAGDQSDDLADLVFGAVAGRATRENVLVVD